MAERLLERVARLLGGVVLMQGRLGHQVLGQLLVARATELEIAGAQVAFAATAGQRNAVAQVAIRTALPTLAIRGLLRKDQNRLLRLRRMMLEKQAATEAAAALATDGAAAAIRAEAARADREASAAAEARASNAALEAENRTLTTQLADLRAQLEALEEITRERPPVPAPIPPPVASPAAGRPVPPEATPAQQADAEPECSPPARPSPPLPPPRRRRRRTPLP